jgi:hypothetical protein
MTDEVEIDTDGTRGAGGASTVRLDGMDVFHAAQGTRRTVRGVCLGHAARTLPPRRAKGEPTVRVEESVPDPTCRRTAEGDCQAHRPLSAPAKANSLWQPKLAVVTPALSELALNWTTRDEPSLENWTEVRAGAGEGLVRESTWKDRGPVKATSYSAAEGPRRVGVRVVVPRAVVLRAEMEAWKALEEEAEAEVRVMLPGERGVLVVALVVVRRRVRERDGRVSRVTCTTPTAAAFWYTVSWERVTETVLQQVDVTVVAVLAA